MHHWLGRALLSISMASVVSACAAPTTPAPLHSVHVEAPSAQQRNDEVDPPPPAEASSASSATAMPPPASTAPERFIYKGNDVQEYFKLRFEAERAEGSWRVTAESELAAGSKLAMPKTSQFLGVECRYELCRIRGVYASVIDYNTFVARLGANPVGPNGADWFAKLVSGIQLGEIQDLSGGAMRVATYLPKAGTPLIPYWIPRPPRRP